MLSAAMTILFQLALASVAFAAPAMHIEGHGNATQYGTGGGIIGFIVLILDIIIIGKAQSMEREVG